MGDEQDDASGAIADQSARLLKMSEQMMLQDATIAELREVLTDAADYFTNDEPLAEDSADGDLLKRIRAALAKGGK